MTPLKTQAIQTALMGDWTSAVTINKQLLKENPNDIETLNRLALAFTVLGKIKDAKSAYQKVLTIDKINPIALKNMKRLLALRSTRIAKSQNVPHLAENIASMFVEETGKTKVIELINLAEPQKISHLMAGEKVILHVKRLKIFVLDGKEQFIGMLPDDIGKRLIKFIKGGNVYSACVKAVVNHKVIVFIKEVKRANRFRNQPSFTLIDKNKMSITKSHSSEKDADLEDGPSDDEDEASLA